MRRSQIDEHPEVAAFFERCSHAAAGRSPHGASRERHGIVYVIPVEKAIETEQEAHRAGKNLLLAASTNRYARACAPAVPAATSWKGEGCGIDVENWCIAVGDMADYVVQTQQAVSLPTRPWRY